MHTNIAGQLDTRETFGPDHLPSLSATNSENYVPVTTVTMICSNLDFCILAKRYVSGPGGTTALQVKPPCTVLPVHNFPYIIAHVFGTKITHSLT